MTAVDAMLRRSFYFNVAGDAESADDADEVERTNARRQSITEQWSGNLRVATVIHQRHNAPGSDKVTAHDETANGTREFWKGRAPRRQPRIENAIYKRQEKGSF